MSTHTENNYFGCKGSSYALFPFSKHTVLVTVIKLIKIYKAAALTTLSYIVLIYRQVPA